MKRHACNLYKAGLTTNSMFDVKLLARKHNVKYSDTLLILLMRESFAMQRDFGKCDETFMTTPAPGLPLGYCQITCGR